MAFDPDSYFAAYAATGASRVGATLVYRDHTTSTMDDARAGADLAGALAGPGGAVYVAGEQGAGRGRQGRTWLSAASAGLYATYHLRTAEAATAPLYTLAGALAARDAILETARLATVLKWPNDVLHLGPDGPRKLCGVLAESRPAGAGVLDVFLGIGINVRAAALPPEVAALATSIEGAGATPPAIEVLLAALSSALERWTDTLTASAPALIEAWKARLVTLGQRVRLATPSGSVDGEAVDVSARGELVLRHDDGALRAYAAGDVTTLRP